MLFFCPAKVKADKHYTTADLMISNTVYNSLRDSRGYIWFTTDKGISRFNGKDFKNYTTLDGLSDNTIINMFEDKLGRLWLFTYNGSYCYILNDKVFNASNDPLLEGMPVISFVRAMCGTEDSSVYFGSNYGDVLKLKGSEVKFIAKGKGAVSSVCALYYSKSTLTVIAENNLSIFKGDKMQRMHNKASGPSFVYGNKIICIDDKYLSLYQDGNLVWQFSGSGIKEKSVIKLYPDDHKNIFCCTQNGLFIVNYETQKTLFLFRNMAITSACQDIDGNYWISALHHGIYSLDKTLDSIHFIGNDISNKLVYSSKGLFCISSGQKILFFDTNTHSFLKLPVHFEENYVPKYITDQYFIFNTGNKTVAYNSKSKKNIGISNYQAKICYPYDQDCFLSVTDNMVHNNIFINDTVSQKDAFPVRRKILNLVFQKKTNKFYLLTSRELYEYDPFRYKLNIIDTFSAPNTPSTLFCIEDRIIVLTNNHYISYKGPQCDKKLFNFNDYIFFDIFDLGDNELLTHTNKGYYLLKSHADHLLEGNFVKIEYPFKSNEIIDMYAIGNDVICNANGRLYFFNKKEINRNVSKPYIFIERIAINGKTISGMQVRIKDVKSCSVDILLNSLYFSSSSINYNYRVKTKEDTSQWFTSTGSNINLLLPAYGVYEIELRAVSGNNVFSTAKIILIDWQSPFYYAGWFKSLVILSFATIIFGLTCFYNKRRKKIFRKELEFLQLEHKSINSLLNPHFIFNAINNIQNLVNKNSPDEANDYLAMLSRLIRQNLENLQFNLIPLEKELSVVQNYVHLQNLRFNDRIELTIHSPDHHDHLLVPPLLIHTFVENAVVHGFSRRLSPFKIEINIVLRSDHYLYIDITDNGIGFKSKTPAPGQKTSLGIEMTKKRLARLSSFYKVAYKLEVSKIVSAPGNGTIASIKIYSKFEDFFSKMEQQKSVNDKQQD